MTVLATNYLTMVDVMKQTVGDSIETDIANIIRIKRLAGGFTCDGM